MLMMQAHLMNKQHVLLPHSMRTCVLTRLISLRDWSTTRLRAQEHACRSKSTRPQASSEVAASQPSASTVVQIPEDFPTTALGKVMQAQANFVRVRIDQVEGTEEPPPQPQLLCVVRTLLKKIKQTVLVGDEVEVTGIDWADGRGMVQEVLNRRNSLTDPAIANIDQALMVFSLAQPPFEPSNATRFLVTAEQAGIPVTLVLNKADLLKPEELDTIVSQVSHWGYTPVTVSAHSSMGMLQLREQLIGKVSVLAGPSGVGKSSILNALKSAATTAAAAPDSAVFSSTDDVAACCDSSQNGSSNGEAAQTLVGDEIEGMQAVGSVSAIGRGKHTTRTVTLLQMRSGGLIADTPGFNQPALNFVSSEELPYCFPEIAAIIENQSCRFSNCQHIHEPGCAVRDAELERYPFYLEILEEVKAREDRDRQRSISKRQREGNVRVKSTAGGGIKREALLNSKSHRRESRKRATQAVQQVIYQQIDDDVDDDL